MCSKGIPLEYLQKVLGHSNRAMTEHYIYEEVTEQIDMTDELIRALKGIA